jgi:hypothetical protein
MKIDRPSISSRRALIEFWSFAIAVMFGVVGFVAIILGSSLLVLAI